ncbi:MAG: integrase core domain-containing protein [Sediminibacterium sp.]|nr:integrase core domain-containing protein [Sediminibacterium sp.]
MAIRTRKYQLSALIHHSDRGLQYCSNEYQNLLNNHKIICSMTTDSDPYSNAIAERVNGIIKNEFCIENLKTDLITQQQIIKETIDIYNQERPHYSYSYLTPDQMHRQSKIVLKTYKNTNGSRDIPAAV